MSRPATTIGRKGLEEYIANLIRTGVPLSTLHESVDDLHDEQQQPNYAKRAAATVVARLLGEEP